MNLQWATGRGKYDFKDSPAGASLQESHQLDKDESLELLDYTPGRQIGTSQLQLLQSLDKIYMNALHPLGEGITLPTLSFSKPFDPKRH